MRRLASQKSTTTARFFIAGFLGTIAVLFLSACSNSTSSPGSSGASSTPSAVPASANLPEPCSLITEEEVETALGKGATRTAVYNERLGKQQCRLKPAAAGKIDEIIIGVNRADSWDAMKKAVLEGGTDVKTVTGLGDDAYMGRAVGYNVRKGNKYVQVFGAVTNNDAANDKATRYIAEKASSRL